MRSPGGPACECERAHGRAEADDGDVSHGSIRSDARTDVPAARPAQGRGCARRSPACDAAEQAEPGEVDAETRASGETCQCIDVRHRCQHGAGLRRRLLFFLAILWLLLASGDAQGFWRGASPTDLRAGQGVPSDDVVTIVGVGLIPGAPDYACSFRTTLVNLVRGEFEVRTSPLTVASPTHATCPSPPWDLQATEATLEVYKSDTLLPQDGGSVVVRILPAVSGIAPTVGTAAGGHLVNISGVAFDTTLQGARRYHCRWTGSGGRSRMSDGCTAMSNTLLSCPVPSWSFPAVDVNAEVTVFDGTQPIERLPDSPPLLYSFVPSCAFYSSLTAFAMESKTIVISGFGLSPLPGATCTFRFNNTPDVTTSIQSVHSGDEIQYHCSTPTWDVVGCVSAQKCAYNASLYVYDGNSRQICSSAENRFAFLSSWTSVIGSTGMATGGSHITVTGGGFDPGAHNYVCRFTCRMRAFFSETVAPLNRSIVICEAPSVPSLPCEAVVDLMHGSEFVANLNRTTATFAYQSVWQSTDRTKVPMQGEASMSVYGRFDPGLSYFCEFVSLAAESPPVQTQAAIESDSHLSCSIPAWAEPGNARFSVAIGNGTKLARKPQDEYMIEFTDEVWSSFQPRSALVVGPIELYFDGQFHGSALNYSCKIATSSAIREGFVQNSSLTPARMICELPE